MGSGGSKKGNKNAAGSKEEETPATLLLLGTAGVGKTTITKQVSASMGDGLSATEKKENVDALRHCIVGRMARVVERAAAAETVEEALLGLFEEFEEVSGSYDGNEEKTTKMGGIISKLCANEAFKKVSSGDYPVSYEEGLNDSCAAQFESIYEEIFTSAYYGKVSNDEMMMIRKPTQTINVIQGKFNEEIFLMKDVGGQIHQRSKWPGAFAGATAVMFIVSLMDVFVDGEDGENRLVNSQKIFSSICGSSELMNVPCCVIFNKEDLFKEAIKTKSISSSGIFKDIKEPKEETEDAKFTRFIGEMKSFFRQGYDSVHDGRSVTEVQFYNTCARDAKAVQEILKKILEELNKLAVDAMMN